MDRSDLAGRIDHTILGPTTTRSDVKRLLDETLAAGTSACIPPCYVAEAADYAPSVRLVTVVGFPHGQHTTTTKRDEAVQAWDDGADHIDVVCNMGRLKAGQLDNVSTELGEVVASVPVPVSVTVEAGRLTEEELTIIGRTAVEADVDSITTSTGFDGDVAVADVRRLSEHLPVKAVGGIGTWATARTVLEAGAQYIGTSAGDRIIDEFDTATG